MKRVISLLMILMLALGAWAQTQQGVAYRYNGKNPRTPLGNVTIMYDGNKRTTISTENGAFVLTLVGRKMGDRIGLVTVKKREMMVFNQHAVDEWSVRKEPLMLILCNADEFEKQKENLINIGRREAKKKYDQQKAELEAQLSASQIKEAEYEAALDKAYEELERLQKNIGEYAELFARIDESEIDTLAQKAVELFNQGDVERAIKLFEEGNYLEKLDKAIGTSQQADQLMALAEEAKDKASQDSIKAIQSLKAQIEAYKVKNEWQKAGELLKGLADRLNTVNDCWDYASFCYHQNNYKDGVDYYQRAIALLDQQYEINSEGYFFFKGSLENNLALLYSETQRFEEAEKMYLSALEILQHLAASNPEVYEPFVAVTQNNLADLYRKTQRFEEAEKMYLSALEIHQRLAASNPEVYEPYVAVTQNNLAVLYSNTQRLAEAEKLYLLAIEIRQRLAASNPEAYEPDVATTQNNLAILYENTQRLAEAEKMYLSALEIYLRLAVSNPDANEPYVARIQDNLAVLYSDRFEEAEKLFLSAREIYMHLSINNPDVYKSDITRSNYSLGLLYAIHDKYCEAFHSFYEALEIYRLIKNKNTQDKSYYDGSIKYLRYIYQHFQESGGIPKECEAEVEKIKQMLEE